MPLFRYIAKKSPTELVEETVEAENRESVLSLIASLGYTPVQVSLDRNRPGSRLFSAGRGRGKIKSKHLQTFIRQFASLVRSQVPITRALRILVEQTEDPRLRQVIASVQDTIQKEGLGLSQAMRNFPEVFAPDHISLINAGEVGGVLEQVLDRLAKKIQREEELWSKLRAALIYPALIAVVGVGTVIFLITFVMPKILNVIIGFGSELPLPTKILMGITDMMSGGWFWLGTIFVVAAAVFVLKSLWAYNRHMMDSLLSRIPVIGTLIHQMELARFCRSLGLLLDHGVTILPALEAAIEVVQNRYFQEEFEKIPASVREGNPVSEGLKSLPFTSPLLINTVTIGEEGGRMGEALDEMASYYEQDAERQMQVVASLFEPLIILGIGVVIGFIVMAVLLPIFEISTVVR